MQAFYLPVPGLGRGVHQGWGNRGRFHRHLLIGQRAKGAESEDRLMLCALRGVEWRVCRVSEQHSLCLDRTLPGSAAQRRAQVNGEPKNFPLLPTLTKLRNIRIYCLSLRVTVVTLHVACDHTDTNTHS
ncbi:hypothetical protein DPEC_G00028820 [Dallia pectoralis]|uniref:Uncharacterized protein n=1 Tax=Dallia pectoralis TaxID=75939 RepID=A0ACC2HJN7_DALPE|nr:hypothetical protein DPEC_G00028820 [Dallia pectoralis]